MSSAYEAFDRFDWDAIESVPQPSADPNLFNDDPELAARHGLSYDEQSGAWVQDTSHKEVARTNPSQATVPYAEQPAEPEHTTSVSFSFSVTDPNPGVRAATMGLFGQLFGGQRDTPMWPEVSNQPQYPISNTEYYSSPNSQAIDADVVPDENGYVQVHVSGDSPSYSHDRTGYANEMTPPTDPIDDLSDWDDSQAAAVTPAETQIQPSRRQPEKKPFRVRTAVGAVVLGVMLGGVVSGPAWVMGYRDTAGHIPSLSEIGSAFLGHTPLGK